MSAPSFRLRARGHALFTRPEMKVERVCVRSAPFRGECSKAVLWKPQMRWRVERILILALHRTIAFRRNEVNRKSPTPSASLVSVGGPAPVLPPDEDRAQRSAVAPGCRLHLRARSAHRQGRSPPGHRHKVRRDVLATAGEGPAFPPAVPWVPRVRVRCLAARRDRASDRPHP